MISVGGTMRTLLLIVLLLFVALASAGSFFVRAAPCEASASQPAQCP
jgi:hypothetical protein